MADPQDTQIAELLLELEIAARAAIDQAWAAQKEAEAKGKKVPLANLLVQKGSVSYGLMERVLAHQGDTKLACKGCQTEIGASALDPRAPFTCQGCGKPLPLPDTGQTTANLEGMVSDDPLDAAATVVRQGFIGRTMAGCKIVSKIGEGGMGAVFLATHEFLQRQVAVKILPEYHVHQPGFVERFIRESRSAARITHPNVVQVMDAGRDGQTYYIIMEFVEGDSLEDIQKAEGKLSIERALEYTRHCALGLEAAAEHGIIHRDIKPDNIRIDPKGVAKVADFGLAKEAEGAQSVTVTGGVVGTPLYMSPEQAHGETVDFRSDMYSLGATLYHLVVGKPPFEGPSAITILQKHAMEELPPMADDLEGCPPEVDGLVQTMMAKKREDRFQSYSELVKAIEAVQRGSGSAALPVVRRKRKKKKAAEAKRSPLIPALVVVVLLIAAAGAFVMMDGDSGGGENDGEVVKVDPPRIAPNPGGGNGSDSEVDKGGDSGDSGGSEPAVAPPDPGDDEPEEPPPPTPPAPASVAIKSVPDGAVVFFNGEEIGMTPLNVTDRLQPGKGKLEIVLEGHKPFAEDVEVIAGETFTASITLVEILANVEVKSEPEGASVVLDGELVGKTPLPLEDLKPGTHTLELQMKGYKPLAPEIDITRGDNGPLSFVLEPLPATLKIETDPPGAHVIMDGKDLGESPVERKDLEIGEEHSFEVTLAGYVSSKPWKWTPSPGEVYHPPVVKLARPMEVQNYLEKIARIEGLLQKGFHLRAWRGMSRVLRERLPSEATAEDRARRNALRGKVFAKAARMDLFLRAKRGSRKVEGSADLSREPATGSHLGSRRSFKVSVRTTYESPLSICVFRLSLTSELGEVTGLLPKEGIRLSEDKAIQRLESWEDMVDLKSRPGVVLVVALGTTDDLTQREITDLKVRASRLGIPDHDKYAREVVKLVESWLEARDADYALRAAWIDMDR